jgi:hypothetical protein
METFLAMAYRWGDLNEHHYVIYVGADEQKAVACAQAEENDRGGKYGCVVWGYADAGAEQAVRKVAWFPGTRGGKGGPAMNYRLEMYQTLGHAFHDYAKGTIWLPEDSPDREDKNGDPVKILKPHKADPPQWVIDRVEQEEKICAVMSKIEGRFTEAGR